MSSIFRPVYRHLDDFEKQKVEDIKSIAEDLLATIRRTRQHDDLPVDQDRAVVARCQALAITKLEEAVMWAVKSVTA